MLCAAFRSWNLPFCKPFATCWFHFARQLHRLGARTWILLASCNIWELEPLILHAICKLLLIAGCCLVVVGSGCFAILVSVVVVFVYSCVVAVVVVIVVFFGCCHCCYCCCCGCCGCCWWCCSWRNALTLMLWSMFGCRPWLWFPYSCGFGCSEHQQSHEVKKQVKLCKTKKKENWRNHQGQKSRETNNCVCVVFTIPSAFSCIVEIKALISHGICDIWKIDPFILHSICRILHMIFAAFLNFNLLFCVTTFECWIISEALWKLNLLTSSIASDGLYTNQK